jgi:hypothetical protein
LNCFLLAFREHQILGILTMLTGAGALYVCPLEISIPGDDSVRVGPPSKESKRLSTSYFVSLDRRMQKDPLSWFFLCLVFFAFAIGFSFLGFPHTTLLSTLPPLWSLFRGTPGIAANSPRPTTTTVLFVTLLSMGFGPVRLAAALDSGVTPSAVPFWVLAGLTRIAGGVSTLAWWNYRIRRMGARRQAEAEARVQAVVGLRSSSDPLEATDADRTRAMYVVVFVQSVIWGTSSLFSGLAERESGQQRNEEYHFAVGVCYLLPCLLAAVLGKAKAQGLVKEVLRSAFENDSARKDGAFIGELLVYRSIAQRRPVVGQAEGVEIVLSRRRPQPVLGAGFSARRWLELNDGHGSQAVVHCTQERTKQNVVESEHG